MNQKTPTNISPQELKEWCDDSLMNPILIDVREKDELAIASFNYTVLHFPLGDYSSWIETYSEHLSVDEPIVIICHSGIRSWNFGLWLLEQNSQYQVWNLQGGIDAWSQHVDASIARY